MKSELKSCKLDSIPTSLLLVCLEPILPPLTNAINISLIRRMSITFQTCHRKTTAEEKIDLVILGLHRHIEEGSSMIGKVIERVVKNSMKPVLVVKNRAELAYQNILVGVDFNIHSKKCSNSRKM